MFYLEKPLMKISEHMSPLGQIQFYVWKFYDYECPDSCIMYVHTLDNNMCYPHHTQFK